MREIMFRAWDGKKMIKLMDTEGAGSSSSLYMTDFMGRVSLVNQFGLDNNPLEVIKDIILMQFIGLKDSKGKDIYEGDLIKGVVKVNGDERQTSRGNYSTSKDVEVMGEICFNDEFACFYVSCSQKNYYRTGFWKGTGDTRSERLANNYRQISEQIKIEISKLSEFEIVGNIYEHPELKK
jgi:uncharacterized phage protein (TIGR01671 family)